MMRVAVIADIHGNLTALDAVLANLQDAGVDRVVCLGDVAALGPQPHEVIGRLRDLGCPAVMGNCDIVPLRPVRLSPLDEEGRRWFEIEEWGAAQLTPEDLTYLRAFPPTLTVPLGDDATLLCFHGSPRSNTDSIVATTPDTVLARMLHGYSATVLAGGHTHAPFIRRYQEAVLLNPGSVGFPYEATDYRRGHPPWAEYSIVEWRSGRLYIELRRVSIDVDLVMQALLRSGMPHVEWLVSMWR
ncbi:MAG TPA: metallophosphoesterase family protein [Chloroflexota bacterium]|nr:metallophosphoesterase family protein [Chloroflexota bacterium]